ncbi:MAG: CRISPR-associated endonuclease Cas2 [Chlamydiae bacterium]|nr:CRISPR-associated endonuclease Cas2 [Chlamydiota bacterium]
MPRIRYLVCYDIADPKRLRRVAKVLEAYGRRLQLSVFECSLDKQRYTQAKTELAEILNHAEDQVLFVSLGTSGDDSSILIEAMGLSYTGRPRVTVI